MFEAARHELLDNSKNSTNSAKSAINASNGKIWSHISYQLAKYFKSIHQNSTALQLFNRGMALTDDYQTIETIKTDITEIEKFIQDSSNVNSDQNNKMEVDQEAKPQHSSLKDP